MTKISVIILNWNRGKDVVELIKKLEKQTYKDFEVLVVDNASGDDSVELITQKYPGVRVITNSSNLGKAGFNYGMRKAKGKYFILFDSDSDIGRDVLEKYVEKLKKKVNFGLVCPEVYLEDGRYFGPAYNPLTKKGEGSNVLFFCGTSVGLQKEVFEKVGGFEERFFMCLDELEWATRVRLAGYKVKVFPEIKVKNLKSDSGSDYRKRMGYYYTRNWIWFYAKYLPIPKIPVFITKHFQSVNYRARKEKSMNLLDVLTGFTAGVVGVPAFLGERERIDNKFLTDLAQNVFLDHRSGWKEGVSTTKSV